MLGSETTPVLIATYDNEISINLILPPTPHPSFLFNFTITLWNCVARWGQKRWLKWNRKSDETLQNLRKRVMVTEIWHVLTIRVSGRLQTGKNTWFSLKDGFKKVRAFAETSTMLTGGVKISIDCVRYDKTFKKTMWLTQVAPACLGCVRSKSGVNNHDWQLLCEQKRSGFHYRSTTSLSLRWRRLRLHHWRPHWQ